ncbi:MAG: hypothetical protein LKE33_07985 [Acidaminococcus sp.]|jgi:hypothetical protein|nr:hypothetical protein [Acidaminococcus sp.]MCI2100630.1 hypothetical protein [Acidaminococcus sp.]MCI2114951.1 hypothetical protein [Acidaminococcus sp.]MCI2117030.1 hypothetical protein [Acidaminococcus sp.]
MRSGKGKSRGTITFLMLMMLVLGCQLLFAGQRVLLSFVKNEQLVFRSQQRMALLRSFCRAREEAPLLKKSQVLTLPEVTFHTDKAPVFLQVTAEYHPKGLYRFERVTLWEGGLRTPKFAVRYEIDPPGGRHAACYEGCTENVPLPDEFFRLFSDLKEGTITLPQIDWPDSPLRGHLYQGEDKLVSLSPHYPWEGRAVLFCPEGLTIGRGFTAKGLFWIFCRGDVTIEPEVNLDHVLILASGRINVGKKSQIHGIIAAGSKISWDSDAAFVKDASVLSPFRTPYTYK